MNSVCVVVPTLGRPTLARTLESIAGQLRGDDHCVVVADAGGNHLIVEALFGEYADVRWTYDEWPDGCSGHRARNHAMDSLIEGDLMISIDDDDILAPQALKTIRKSDTSRASIYRMRYSDGRVLWGEPRVEMDNVGSPMIVAPTSCRSRWGARYQGDFDFALSLEREYGECDFHEEIVALIRP